MSSYRPTILRALFWAAMVIAFLAAINPHPPHIPGAPSDKVQHIAAFLVLGALASFAYPRTNPVYLGTALSLFGALIELVQMIPVLRRDGDPIDWVADTAAAALMLIFLHWLRARRSVAVAGKS